MSKYSCFNCPEVGHDNSRELSDPCPTCGDAYGFPLTAAPTQVGKYIIQGSISRGFYGSVYKVADNLLGKNYVLKIIPKAIYDLHKKDFLQECKAHVELAKNSQYIVDINDAIEEKITFGNGREIECYIAVMEYVPGKVLKEILNNNEVISANKIAQIAIDLFRILDVLRLKQKNHNDLHAENIIVEELPTEQRRANEVEGRIRVVAIDIGSLTSENKAGDSPDRIGDVHWVANYLISLSDRLIKNPDSTSDLNYRLATLLEDRAKLLFPASENQRHPNFDEIIESIRNCYYQQAHPWEEPLKLLNFNDTYNAQTLDPWFIPSLLVDPDDQWLNRTSGKGPLVITGMRGCGKTMILRALQFHARAACAKELHKENNEQQIRKLQQEGYVGIYVSCNKLLDELGKASNEPLHEPYSRLFIRYGIEAIKALRHLGSISENAVKQDYYKHLIEAYKAHLSNSENLNDVTSEFQLEQALLRMIWSLNNGESEYIVSANPSNSFPALAQAIRQCSPVWANHYVLFLLDDVSTRYLGEGNIRELLSSLIFQSEECAFKITSEVQTIELLLFSPGRVEKAKKGRDFETFDLGSAVNDKIRNKGGRKFVADILHRRAKGNLNHPPKKPTDLLGDTALENIARYIVTRGDDKTQKKRIYHGLSALAGVCIGDIGDMINLYDLIIRRYDHDKQVVPIPAVEQNECFQDLCSIRLHEVNRRGSNFKDFALSFAEASSELLMKSAKDGSSRLRQYYSIYVRITTGDTEKQYEKIRELLDAGIFVYSGGANTPRTLGNDTNPISQFKLTYRKLYGLSKLIGLTNGDRFELSGDQTEEWLNNPSKGKDILMKNVGGPGSNVDEGELTYDTSDLLEDSNAPKTATIQQELAFDIEPDITTKRYEDKDVKNLIESKTPKSETLNFNDLSKVEFDVVIAALGFEDRSLEAIKDILNLKFRKIILVQYDEKGKSEEVIKLINESKVNYEIIKYDEVKTKFNILEGTILCDVSGMSKSVIFNVVRNSLKINGQLFISHVQAEKYYPLNEEIDSILETSTDNNYDILEAITSKVTKGEQQPYEAYNLLMSDADESKRNLLIGFSTAKYERLFKILENRQFDRTHVFTSNKENSRAKVSNLAAEVISKTYHNTTIEKIEANSLNETIERITFLYQKYYVDQNYNFEISLTGSKNQTVACATICAAFKVSQCWYIKPAQWDINNFSIGVGEKKYYKIRL